LWKPVEKWYNGRKSDEGSRNYVDIGRIGSFGGCGALPWGTPKIPLCKGQTKGAWSCHAISVTEGLSLREQPLRPKSKILPTSPYIGEAFRCGGSGHSESFLEPPAQPVVFLNQ